MYTELIFASKLKTTTPNTVINTLRYMMGEIEIPKELNFNEGVFNAGSFYFPVSKALNNLFHDGDNWILSHRGNYKDQDNNGFIEAFLNWIKPYIEKGSGNNSIYAITIHEDSNEIISHTL